MKAIILAAGKGKRMLPLTKTIPKTLVEVSGRPLIDHIINALPKEVDEFIVVIGYKGEEIKKHLKFVYPNKKISYIRQKKLRGTADAVLKTKHLFSSSPERFLIIYGDELPTKNEVKKCLKYEYSWLCHNITRSISTGVVKIAKSGRIIGVLERRSGSKPPSISVGGLMIVDSRIFNYKPWRHKDGEYYLTSMLGQFLKVYPMYAVIGRADLYFTSYQDVDKFNRKT
jgi:NDP-sugar pyrophosphorylase family protein